MIIEGKHADFSHFFLFNAYLLKMYGLYFIAIIPPNPHKEDIEKIKQEFCQKFGPIHALKSPPHITMVPPMKLQESELNLMNKRIKSVIKHEKSFELSAFRFSAFSPRVIFIDFVKSNELRDFHNRLTNILEIESKYQFSPHMTIAFRDMKPPVFHRAWKEYKHKSISFKFLVDQLYVLKHDGKKWQTNGEFLFADSTTN